MSISFWKGNERNSFKMEDCRFCCCCCCWEEEEEDDDDEEDKKAIELFNNASVESKLSLKILSIELEAASKFC